MSQTIRRFSLGQVVATPGAIAALHATGETPLPYVTRHAAGDWGDLEEGDKRMNDLATTHDERILSAYTLTDGTRIYIITEGDRSATTILLPEEY